MLATQCHLVRGALDTPGSDGDGTLESALSMCARMRRRMRRGRCLRANGAIDGLGDIFRCETRSTFIGKVLRSADGKEQA